MCVCVCVTMFCLGGKNVCSENSTKQNRKEVQRWQIYIELSGKILEEKLVHLFRKKKKYVLICSGAPGLKSGYQGLQQCAPPSLFSTH